MKNLIMLFCHMNLVKKCDKCLYSKIYGDYVVVVCLYMDDMLILNYYMEGMIEQRGFYPQLSR